MGPYLGLPESLGAGSRRRRRSQRRPQKHILLLLVLITRQKLLLLRVKQTDHVTLRVTDNTRIVMPHSDVKQTDNPRTHTHTYTVASAHS